MVPLFDSLTHPTINGTWLDRQNNNTFKALVTQLQQEDQFTGACAVGLAGKDDYSHDSFIKKCRHYSQLIPIAGVNPLGDGIEEEINYLTNLGFKGLKIHPRFSLIAIEKHVKQLSRVFEIAAENNLVVFYCTYPHCDVKNYPEKSPFYSLVSILKLAPKTKVVLLHGGDVQLLQYAELVRFSPNLLLDLSFTIFRYQGTSIDLDIQYLFKTLDQKICVGTDWPEYSFHDLRQRFEHFAQGLSLEKQENIGFRNITSLFK